MMLKLRLPFLAAVLALVSLINACAEDEPAPAEAVQPSAQAAPEIVTEEPPPVAPAPSTSFAPETVYFDFDDYTLRPDAQEKLNSMAEQLKSNAGTGVTIEGHCDERGSNEYNLALGERRAQSVKDFLSNHGIDAGRMNTISYGEEKPVADGHAEGAWSKNRRAEFVTK